MYLRSKLGEVKHIEQWEQELNEFWGWVEKQNRYICRVDAQHKRREFKKPTNAFHRYAKLLGLERVPSPEEKHPEPSYKGVF